MSPREKKLEEALRAATKLRRAIEPIPGEGEVEVKSLFVPIAAVNEYDAKIEELKS